MKKYLLMLPLLFLGSFGYAEGLPELPMDIYGNTNVEGTLEVYANNSKIALIQISDGKYGSTNASKQHLILNKFNGNLTFKVVKDGKTYEVQSITGGEGCPSKDNITFVSKTCRYDITFKDQETTVQAGGGGGIVSTQTNKQQTTIIQTVVKEQTNELTEAYKFAYKYGITTKDTMAKADMTGSLTRVAMAKMLSQYAINVLGKKSDTSKYPNFNDVSIELNAMYDNGVVLAYQLGIMGIGIQNFRPYDTVTRAEFGTALSRLLYGTTDGNPYYITHLNRLKQEGVISNTNPNLQETRGYVMLMLMRSFNK